jgi:hypothetical protein
VVFLVTRLLYAGQHRHYILWTADFHSVYYDCRGATVGDRGSMAWMPANIAVPHLLSMISMIWGRLYIVFRALTLSTGIQQTIPQIKQNKLCALSGRDHLFTAARLVQAACFGVKDLFHYGKKLSPPPRSGWKRMASTPPLFAAPRVAAAASLWDTASP